jgi:hypothetical protein
MELTPPVVLVVAAVVVVVAFVVTVALAQALAGARAESARLRHELAAVTDCIERLAETERARYEAQVAQANLVAVPDQYVITRADDGHQTGDVPASRRTVALTMGPSLVKLAALSYGVGRALSEETRSHIAFQVRREIRRRRRHRRQVRRQDW